MTPADKVQAQKLLEMIDAVNEEGRKTSNELVNEAVFGLRCLFPNYRHE